MSSLGELVAENLAEELDTSNPHPLALACARFAEVAGCGRSRSTDGATPLPGITTLLDTFDEVTSEGTLAQAAASFYAYEAQVPEIATEKISGLREVLWHYRAPVTGLFRCARRSGRAPSRSLARMARDTK